MKIILLCACLILTGCVQTPKWGYVRHQYDPFPTESMKQDYLDCQKKNSKMTCLEKVLFGIEGRNR